VARQFRATDAEWRAQLAVPARRRGNPEWGRVSAKPS